MHKHKCVVNYYQYLVKVVDLIKKRQVTLKHTFRARNTCLSSTHYALHTLVINLYSKLSIGHRSKKKKPTSTSVLA